MHIPPLFRRRLLREGRLKSDVASLDGLGVGPGDLPRRRRVRLRRATRLNTIPRPRFARWTTSSLPRRRSRGRHHRLLCSTPSPKSVRSPAARVDEETPACFGARRCPPRARRRSCKRFRARRACTRGTLRTLRDPRARLDVHTRGLSFLGTTAESRRAAIREI